MVAHLLLAAGLFGAGAPEPPRPGVEAVRLSGPVVVDGIPDEPAWSMVPAYTAFVQRDPIEGGAPGMRTEVRVAYDDAALYIAARMYDPAPDSIVARLGRRDVLQNADLFQLYLDPYRDGRSGFYFGLDPAGTYYDGILYNDDWSDDSWDGVWEGKVHRDAGGWTVEMRIPFSQLRFREEEGQDWGIDFRRDIARRSESDWAVFTPKNASGFVSRFIPLGGIRDIHPPRDVEVLPYVTTRAEYLQHAGGDPFHTGSRYVPRMGGDLKIGLGTNLTLDATVNPDFGQVEVDPAVVNLSDVETYFNEKRPFFIEGASTFRFGRGGVVNYWGFNWSDPEFFYTRRIGRAPQGSIPTVDFSDVPSGTDILGAAKLSGKLGDSWNVGALQALTGRTYADLQSAGVRSSLEVEPSTYYGIARVQKDFDGGREGLGVISTTTSRFFRDPALRDQLNAFSTVDGIDGWTFLDGDKSWVMSGWGAASLVRGDRVAMAALQSNSEHYLQRPDAVDFRIDSSATSMAGYAGRVVLAKQRGDFFFNSAFGVINPRFDNSDLGYLWRADAINMHAGGGYQWVTPTDWYHRLEAGMAFFQSYDYDGDLTWRGGYWYGTIQLPDYSQIRLDYAYNPATVNPRRTRGGPVTMNWRGYQVDWEYTTDVRKDVDLDVSSFMYNDRETSWNLYAMLDIKPSRNIAISFGPGIERNVDYVQWVGSFPDPSATATYGARYVFALLNQTTVSGTIRLNWTFTPELSLQLYVQPLISEADYRDFRELALPRSYSYIDYGTSGSTIALAGGTYTVVPPGPGAVPFSFADPSFNLKSFRGNAVLRWEYLPGSTIYVVWTQTRARSDVTGDFAFNRSLGEMMGVRPDNIFMVKMTYWWNR
ncbi:MAG TPA: DUF5916 domain-containing protein [Bacteroidota bacterium]|nr:DUF5916 domain-containing protein [Bacteroidota bacterium]